MGSLGFSGVKWYLLLSWFSVEVGKNEKDII